MVARILDPRPSFSARRIPISTAFGQTTNPNAARGILTRFEEACRMPVKVRFAHIDPIGAQAETP